MRRMLAVLLCVLAFASVTVAQSESASLTGRVIDPQGAVVVGATVTATNRETKVATDTRTNGSGIYNLPSLPPGPYQLVVRAQDFQENVIERLVLHVQDRVSQDIALQIGSVAQTFTVNAERQPVNTQDAAVGTVVERQVVENMPLNGRSFQELITLSPGVATVPAGTNTPGQFVVNGQRTDTNYFTVDGVSANVAAPILGSVNANGTGSEPTAAVTGGFNNLVSVDALEEFRISTSSFAPEFGRTPGGQISLVTRSGTNGFHGDAFDYLRNTVLDANDWFLNAKGKPRGVVQQNDFGGVFGGPIVKRKLFFFGSYEGLRLNAPSPAIKVVPTQATRSLASAAVDNGVTGYMAQFLNAYPLPDGNPTTACTSSATCFANYTATLPGTSKLDSGSVRGDYSINGHMNVFFRYTHAPSQTVNANTVVNISLIGGNDTYTSGWAYAITQNLSNDLHFNYTKTTFVRNLTPLAFKGDLSTIFPTGFAQPPSSYATPTISVIIGTGIANMDSFQIAPANANNGNEQHNITEALNFIKGSHGFKFGADYRDLEPIFNQSNFNANYQFALNKAVAPLGANNCPTSALPAGSSATVPGYICGQATLANIQHNVPQEFRFREYSFFGQHTWKATDRFTVTYGLRWDINPAVEWTDGFPGFSINRSSFSLSNMLGYTLNPMGTPAFATRWQNVAPRVGLAYQASKDAKWGTVLRAGYGIFYDTGNQAFAIASAPWNARFNNQGAGATVAIVPFPISIANAVYATPPVIPNPPSFPLPLGTDILIDPNFRLPYVQQLNATIEQQIGEQQTVSLSYVGALGRRLIGYYVFPPNCPTANPTCTIRTNPAVLGNGTVGDAITVIGNYSQSDYEALQTKFQRQFYKGFSAVASYTWSHSIDNSSVNASVPVQSLPTAASLNSGLPINSLLRASSDFNIGHNLAFSIVYDIPTPFTGTWVSRTVLGHWSVDPIYHYQTAIPYEVFASTTAAFFGATGLGQRPNIIPGVPVYVTGAACVAEYQAAQGISACPGGFALNTATPTASHAAAAGCAAPTATNAKGAFCMPLPVGTQAVSGNAGRNIARAFPLQQFDLSLHREFPIRESVRIRFQADMFNVLNQPNVGSPGFAGGSTVPMNNANFGLANSMANSALGANFSTGAGFNPLYNTGGPRNFQFALKLFF